MKWWDVVLKFLPGILGWLEPTLVPLASQIVDGVIEAEQVWGPGTGPQKLAHVQKLTSDAVNVAVALGPAIDLINKLTKQINTPGVITLPPSA